MKRLFRKYFIKPIIRQILLDYMDYIIYVVAERHLVTDQRKVYTVLILKGMISEIDVFLKQQKLFKAPKK